MAEEHVLQRRLHGSEAFIRAGLVVHVDHRTPCDELVADHAMLRELGFAVELGRDEIVPGENSPGRPSPVR